jgi:hypothetical protein
MALRKWLLIVLGVSLALRSFALAALPGEPVDVPAEEPDITCLAALLAPRHEAADAMNGGSHATVTHNHAGTCVHLCAMAAALTSCDWPQPAATHLAPMRASSEFVSVSVPPPLEPPRSRG